MCTYEENMTSRKCCLNPIRRLLVSRTQIALVVISYEERTVETREISE